MSKVRIGLMGFGEIPRHIYRKSIGRDDVEVVAISEIGKPEILHYLVNAEVKRTIDVRLEGNFLVSDKGKARIVRGVAPGDVPWDMYDVDYVVDGTWKYRKRADMEKHLNSGAKRVLLSSLPDDEIDRIVVKGVNEKSIRAEDRLISPGSATMNATAIMLRLLDQYIGLEYAMLTTVHSYTSDQPLRDKAGDDFRRSRSAAENIIPIETPTPKWIGQVCPEFKGIVEGSAINVPVPNGSLLDLTSILKTKDFTLDDIHEAVRKKAEELPGIVKVINDPIVSADVIGDSHSVIYDKIATMRSASRMVKTLTWYHAALSMAARIIDVILEYQKIDEKGGSK